MVQKHPFLEDGSQYGVSRFRQMRKAEKRELMLRWFSENFEDPAVRTPYESAEGGYQWIWGGPYEARDELYSKFGDLVSESLIEEVVEEVEREGLTDWALVSSPDDYDETEPPDEPATLDIYLDEPSSQYGTQAEQQARKKALIALGPVDCLGISFYQQIRFKAAFGEAVLGVMDRLVLSDAAWERMAPLIIGRPDQKGSTGRDNRMFVEGVLWIVRTGSPWRDLPEVFGDWNSVFRRFSRWSTKGVWWRIFEAMSDDPDFEYLIVDSTIVRAHQHAAGAKKGV